MHSEEVCAPREFLSFLKCFCSVFFLFKTGSGTCRRGRGWGLGRGGQRGREEGGQKDGGNERKSKEENQENKNYIQDCTEEEEWDEELKSIYLLFFCFLCFPRVHFHVLQSKSFFFLFKFPSHTSHFLIFYFFLPFFIIIVLFFRFAIISV